MFKYAITLITLILFARNAYACEIIYKDFGKSKKQIIKKYKIDRDLIDIEEVVGFKDKTKSFRYEGKSICRGLPSASYVSFNFINNKLISVNIRAKENNKKRKLLTFLLKEIGNSDNNQSKKETKNISNAFWNGHKKYVGIYGYNKKKYIEDFTSFSKNHKKLIRRINKGDEN